MGQADERLLSAEEYLCWERNQPVKHEYVHGAVVAMAGATIAHNKIRGRGASTTSLDRIS